MRQAEPREIVFSEIGRILVDVCDLPMLLCEVAVDMKTQRATATDSVKDTKFGQAGRMAAILG